MNTAAQAASAPAPQPKILIIDDDESQRVALGELLEPEGFAVSTAITAEEGLERCRTERFDVVLCDLHLPGRSGLWLVGALGEAQPEVASVLVTGQGSTRIAMTALRRGAVEYLTKPVRPRRLLALCRALVAGRGDRLRLRSVRPDEAVGDATDDDSPRDYIRIPVGTRIDAVEREVILRTLAAKAGNKTAAAEALGISRRSIYNKLAEYGFSSDETDERQKSSG
jgi:DNA-binding NtrC family response regulator